MSRRLLLFAGLAASTAFGIALGAATSAHADDPYAGLDRLGLVLNRVQTDYVEEIPTDKLVDAAVEGIVEHDLDSHSRWLTPDEYHALQDDTEGSYEGIGVDLRPVPEGVRIARVLPDSPASRDGLASGDLIVAVDHEPLAGKSIDDVSARLKGRRGDPIALTVQRVGWDAPHEIVTRRDRVVTPAVDADAVVLDGVAYIHLEEFQAGASREIDETWRRLAKDKAPTALVLDLRDNPGGLLDEAVSTADLFLDDGIIVSTRGRSEGTKDYKATPGGLPHDLRVVVLVNGMSASSAEIVSAALQDTGRARLVGEPTYGKGTVQTVFRNPDDSALKLTVARYYTPSGKPVADRQGRVPDVIVAMPPVDGPKQQLAARLGAASGLSADDRTALLALAACWPDAPTPAESVPWDVPAATRAAHDPQLARALALARAPTGSP